MATSGSGTITPISTDLKDYMEDVLGDTASKMGWKADDGDFDSAFEDLQLVTGITDFGSQTGDDLLYVKMAARVEAWRFAMYATVHEASFSAGNPGTGNTNRGEIHRHAKEMYELARYELNTRFPDKANEYNARTVSISYSDPYESIDLDDINEWSRINS